MRIALLSDIHGNTIALDAVLADIRAQGGVETYWVLGDLAAIGYDPVGALERLAALPHARFVRGNTDRYLVTGERPPPSIEEASGDRALVQRAVQVAASFAWTQGAVTAAGWLDWLAALPLELRIRLPDGTRFLGVHASPGTDDGDGIYPTMSDAALAQAIDGCDANLICVGHTHRPMNRLINGVRVVNLGSVSNPNDDDLRASYAVLDADDQGYQVGHRRVAYDVQAVIEAVERSRHPARAFVNSHFQGLRRPSWE